MANEVEEVFGSDNNDNIDQVFGEINSDPTVQDVPGGNTPKEMTEGDINKVSNDLRADDAERKTIYTNQWYPDRLLTKGYNTAAWAAAKHGSLPVDNKKGDVPVKYQGQTLPIKTATNPSQPWDGYRMVTPDGTDDIRKSDILSWMLNKTLGRTLGHATKRLVVAKDKNVGASSKTKPLQVKKHGLTASNPEHILETFEPIPGEFVNRTVSLVVPDVKDGETAPKLKGVVTDYPKLRRKKDFTKTLGLLGTSGSKGKGNTQIPIGGVDQADEIKNWFELMSIAREHNMIEE